MSGFSKAVGNSRKPEQSLTNNEQGLNDCFRKLSLSVEKLKASNNTDDVQKWEEILDGFRPLTISATASDPEKISRLFMVNLYELAAETALRGENFGYYLACQSRLIGDLYPLIDNPDKKMQERASELFAYNLLYFGVLTLDSTELAVQMRRLDKPSLDALFALQAISCVLSRDGFGFLNLFARATSLQKIIMRPRLEAMRHSAAEAIIRTYLSLETQYACSLLHLDTSEQVFRILLEINPDLKAYNTDHRAPIITLRVPRVKK